jgi:hypothetical protein
VSARSRWSREVADTFSLRASSGRQPDPQISLNPPPGVRTEAIEAERLDGRMPLQAADSGSGPGKYPGKFDLVGFWGASLHGALGPLHLPDQPQGLWCLPDPPGLFGPFFILSPGLDKSRRFRILPSVWANTRYEEAS